MSGKSAAPTALLRFASSRVPRLAQMAAIAFAVWWALIFVGWLIASFAAGDWVNLFNQAPSAKMLRLGGGICALPVSVFSAIITAEATNE